MSFQELALSVYIFPTAEIFTLEVQTHLGNYLILSSVSSPIKQKIKGLLNLQQESMEFQL